MQKLICPKCKSTKILAHPDLDDVGMCEHCEYSNTYEDSIYGKGFLQPTQVPYKYHTINEGIFKSMTLSEHDLWDEIREDRI